MGPPPAPSLPVPAPEGGALRPRAGCPSAWSASSSTCSARCAGRTTTLPRAGSTAAPNSTAPSRSRRRWTGASSHPPVHKISRPQRAPPVPVERKAPPLPAGHPPDFHLDALQYVIARSRRRRFFRHTDLRAPTALQAARDGRVEQALLQPVARHVRIGQQAVHAQTRQLYNAVIIAQTGGIAGGTVNTAHQAGHRDPHDGGGDDHLQQRESALACHFISTLSTRGKPVIGSSRTTRCALRRLPNWIPMAGTVAPGRNRMRRGWAGSPS